MEQCVGEYRTGDAAREAVTVPIPLENPPDVA
jgi:hypothetical protein